MRRGEEGTTEGLGQTLHQHFLDQFVYSGLPHVKLSDSLHALFSSPPFQGKTISVCRRFIGGRGVKGAVDSCGQQTRSKTCWTLAFSHVRAGLSRSGSSFWSLNNVRKLHLMHERAPTLHHYLPSSACCFFLFFIFWGFLGAPS